MGLIVLFGLLSWNFDSYKSFASISMNPAYDLSQWQQPFTASQVQELKNEVSFVILRVQYGSQYQDSTFQNNVKLIHAAGIPYGVYSYSMYTSPSDAESEASKLYSLAPGALFYVNDIEENNAGDALSASTIAWADQLRKETSRPLVIYSGLSFMNDNLTTAKNAYNAIWIASYSSDEPNPNYHYDLWQYTDKRYSNALNQSVDASVIPTGGKPLSFWTNTGSNKTKTPRKIKVNVSVHKTKNTTKRKHVKKINIKRKQKSQYHKSKSVSNTTQSLQKHYYTSSKIVYLKVINKNGVGVYNANNTLAYQAKYGTTIMISAFKRVGNTIQSITLDGAHFTAKKGYVKPV